jgi:hypothetical protein
MGDVVTLIDQREGPGIGQPRCCAQATPAKLTKFPTEARPKHDRSPRELAHADT